MQVLKFIENPTIYLLYSNKVGEQVKKYLNERGENLVACFTPDIEQDSLEYSIMSIKPDLIITCYWPYLLRPEIIAIPKYGCINFHPALLPENRGWYPTVWEVLYGENAGVTLHLIDEGADTGMIINQRKFKIEESDTGGTVYEKSMDLMVELFKETWEDLYDNGIALKKQNEFNATYHSKKEGNTFNEINLKADYNAEHLLKIIKAKTFNDKSYAYYIKNGKKYYVRIDVYEE
jgi:methionyl-tRNA formyltransferase